MATADFMLGISISDTVVQAVEIRRDGPIATLLAIDEWENTVHVDEARRAANGVQQFEEYLAAFLKVNKVKARRASVALDTAFLFINTLPFEDGLPLAEMKEHINWELTQYFPDEDPKGFVSDVQKMTALPDTNRSEYLSVSVRRPYVQTIARALEKQNLELDVLDADHFSADTALRINYPDTHRRYLALVGIKESRLDISFIRNGNLEGYIYKLVHSNQEIVDEIGNLSRETPGIFSITAYGPYLQKELLVRIRRGSTLLVEALNPLRHVNVSDTLRLAEHLSGPSYRFASAVGVALRQE